MKTITLWMTVGLIGLGVWTARGDGTPIGGGTNIFYTTNIFPASATASATNVPTGGAATASVTGSNILTFIFGVPIGATGASGTNGLNGTNGVNGTNGLNGATGATGAAGANGTNGLNGAGSVLSHSFVLSSGLSQNWAHGYGKSPAMLSGVLLCTTADGGLAVNQSVQIMDVQDASYSQPYFSLGCDGTSLYVSSVSTTPTVARVLFNGARNNVTNWNDFTLIVDYQ